MQGNFTRYFYLKKKGTLYAIKYGTFKFQRVNYIPCNFLSALVKHNFRDESILKYYIYGLLYL